MVMWKRAGRRKCWSHLLTITTCLLSGFSSVTASSLMRQLELKLTTNGWVLERGHGLDSHFVQSWPSPLMPYLFHSGPQCSSRQHLKTFQSLLSSSQLSWGRDKPFAFFYINIFCCCCFTCCLKVPEKIESDERWVMEMWARCVALKRASALLLPWEEASLSSLRGQLPPPYPPLHIPKRWDPFL